MPLLKPPILKDFNTMNRKTKLHINKLFSVIDTYQPVLPSERVVGACSGVNYEKTRFYIRPLVAAFL